MKTSRTELLIAAMLVLAGLRWWTNLSLSEVPEIVQPMARDSKSRAGSASRQVAPPNQPSSADVPLSVERVDISAGTRESDEVEIGNPFNIRTQTQTGAVPIQGAVAHKDVKTSNVAPVTSSVPVVLPVAVPQTSPEGQIQAPSVQVIGSLHDDTGLSVFVAGARGTTQVRIGDAITPEFRVSQISAQQVLVKHLATGRELGLTVAGQALAALK